MFVPGHLILDFIKKHLLGGSVVVVVVVVVTIVVVFFGRLVRFGQGGVGKSSSSFLPLSGIFIGVGTK